MIIDAHCHIYPDKIALKASQSTGKFYSKDIEYDGSISTLLEQGKIAEVDKFIVESVATTPAQVKSINNFIAESVSKYPQKFFGLGTLHPDSENIKGDIEHLISLGLKGVKIHPDIQGFKLDDFRCLKIYELCENFGLPILIHTGDSRYDLSNPNRLSPLLEIYTSLIFIGAHFGGYSMWEKACDVLHKYENLYVDCSSSFFALDDDTIISIIRKYGADKVLYGSDYPMWNMKENLDRFLSLDLTDCEKEKILYKNAVKVFSLEI